MIPSLVSIALSLAALHHQEPSAAQDTAVIAAATCIAKGAGNFFLYQTIWKGEVVIADGDVLHYDIYLDRGNPVAKGGIDLSVRAGTPLRDMGATDDHGLRAHGDALLDRAAGQWLHRAIGLGSITGKTVTSCEIVFEGDPAGSYVQFLDQVEIRHRDGSKVVLLDDGDPRDSTLASASGYARDCIVLAVPRARVRDHEPIDALIEEARALGKMLSAHAELKEELRFVRAVVERSHDQALEQSVSAIELAAPLDYRDDPDGFAAELHERRTELAHTHPLMKQYSGHLVGHAHIDFQWLWEWPETIDVCKQTFGQATRFMDEYPDFTFTQSSAALYLATEENHPEIFAKMQHYAKQGRWDLAGGRWCEGDTNMISAESHARHFLYGQRYFREKFGKTCTVGWEPDTFGHVATMPQILQAAGIRFYYFCRAGKGIPLFWWQGPDGSRVLAFEEPATGSWYNSDVNTSALWELLKFEDATGLKDLLWVYGVGNHGGGPTRENIEVALDWQKKDYLPRVTFATAGGFFSTIEKRDLSKIPVVNTELNSVFEGCYTTHGNIKRWNRDAERWTEGAEALCTAATLLGASYPQDDFKQSWIDILWNHHHDTLPGTSIHASYERSRKMYAAAIARSQAAHAGAAETIASHLAPAGAGTGIVVVNDLPWARDGLVTAPLPAELAGKAASLVVADAARRRMPAQVAGDQLLFLARQVPTLGARSYAIGSAEVLGTDGHGEPRAEASIASDGTRLETSCFLVELDAKTALVRRIFDKRHQRDVLAPGAVGNLVEAHLEQPNGMSAWVIGKIVGVERLDHEAPIEVLERGPLRVRAQCTRRYRSSVITQEIALTEGIARIDFAITIDWRERGSASSPGNPFLKVAFPVNVTGGEARYELPFGDIARATDGKEWPALKWIDLSRADYGVSLLNDSKHGHSVDGQVMRLSLVRCSYYPDPEPDQYVQRVAYSLVPHAGDSRDGEAVRRGFELNRPLTLVTPARPQPDLGTEVSFLTVEPSSVVLTALKLAEDDGSWVARVYESAGKPATVHIAACKPIESASEVNLLEDVLRALPIEPDRTLSFAIKPDQIRTVKLVLAK
ncbi:MAG: glycoside hydrolase family 38 C-terminal domain-containing protein [Planctomycetota bacterium]